MQPLDLGCAELAMYLKSFPYPIILQFLMSIVVLALFFQWQSRDVVFGLLNSFCWAMRMDIFSHQQTGCAEKVYILPPDNSPSFCDISIAYVKSL